MHRNEFADPAVPCVTGVYDLVIVPSHQLLWRRSRLRFLLVSAGFVLAYLALHLLPCLDGHAEAAPDRVAVHEPSAQHWDDPRHHMASSAECAESLSDPHDETCVATPRSHGSSEALFLALPLVAAGWGQAWRFAPACLPACRARWVVPRPGRDVLRSLCVLRR